MWIAAGEELNVLQEIIYGLRLIHTYLKLETVQSLSTSP
jgi:hypothetical protein